MNIFLIVTVILLLLAVLLAAIALLLIKKSKENETAKRTENRRQYSMQNTQYSALHHEDGESMSANSYGGYHTAEGSPSGGWGGLGPNPTTAGAPSSGWEASGADYSGQGNDSAAAYSYGWAPSGYGSSSYGYAGRRKGSGYGHPGRREENGGIARPREEDAHGYGMHREEAPSEYRRKDSFEYRPAEAMPSTARPSEAASCYRETAHAERDSFPKEAKKTFDSRPKIRKARFCGCCGTPFEPETGAVWCSRCGSRLPGTEDVTFKETSQTGGPGAGNPPTEVPQIDAVNFSALAPEKFVRGETGILNIAMYTKEFRSVVDRMIREYDGGVRKYESEQVEVKNRSQIKIILYSPDIEIRDNIETRIWRGDYLRFSFLVPVPVDYRKRDISFIASVYIEGVIATKLKLAAKCNSPAAELIRFERRDILSAFMSYAHMDRHDVMLIIQGIKKVRPDLKLFVDVESLRSGTNWEKAVKAEIDRRDMFFLCWSRNARDSSEVGKEWRYALDTKGIDSIEPIPLEPPEMCPPPAELSGKHFNDKYMYFSRNWR